MNQDAIAMAIAEVMPAALSTGLFISRCTFQVPVSDASALDASGFPTGAYVNVSGLVNIRCTAPPSALGPAIQAKEQKSEGEILALNMSHVLLDGYYPAADAAWRQAGRAVIDGTNYDILGVESDSQHQMTRTEVRVASI